MGVPYRDRRDGGAALAARLLQGGHAGDDIVLALPRGGVPVAFEVALALGLPLDVFVVRKLGFPGHEELAIGAIASGGVRILNHDLVREAAIPPETIDRIAARELGELTRRERLYRGDEAPALAFAGKRVIVVDDGLATGSSMLAAVTALRQGGAAHITVAVPVAAAETCAELRHHADEVVCEATPAGFVAVGLWYHDFAQTTDGEVRRLLAEARARDRPAPHAGAA